LIANLKGYNYGTIQVLKKPLQSRPALQISADCGKVPEKPANYLILNHPKLHSGILVSYPYYKI
jgi:hypothetical protein